MYPCKKCGGKHFTVEANYAARDRIVLLDQEEYAEEFEVIDTDYGDGEWSDDSTVHCCDCDDEWPYSEWKDRGPEEVKP